VVETDGVVALVDGAFGSPFIARHVADEAVGEEDPAVALGLVVYGDHLFVPDGYGMVRRHTRVTARVCITVPRWGGAYVVEHVRG
jgi:hypothetical protein